MPPGDQQAFLFTGFHAGYRFAPLRVTLREHSHHVRSLGYRSHRHGLLVETLWANTGITPAYNLWQVEFSLWRLRERGGAPSRASFVGISRIDLQSVLPTGATPVVVWDDFALPRRLEPGLYELKVTIIDPDGYLNPLHLALQDEAADGSYSLGEVRLHGAEFDDED